eukprot:2996254-Rhodomonas_salina.1
MSMVFAGERIAIIAAAAGSSALGLGISCMRRLIEFLPCRKGDEHRAAIGPLLKLRSATREGPRKAAATGSKTAGRKGKQEESRRREEGEIEKKRERREKEGDKRQREREQPASYPLAS